MKLQSLAISMITQNRFVIWYQNLPRMNDNDIYQEQYRNKTKLISPTYRDVKNAQMRYAVKVFLKCISQKNLHNCIYILRKGYNLLPYYSLSFDVEDQRYLNNRIEYHGISKESVRLQDQNIWKLLMVLAYILLANLS